jgi:hypothetical protein
MGGVMPGGLPARASERRGRDLGRELANIQNEMAANTKAGYAEALRARNQSIYGAMVK